MNIEKQVCSIDQALELVKLGVIHIGATFYFVADDEVDAKNPELVYGDGYNWCEYPGYGHYKFVTPAFTCSELGIALGDFLKEVDLHWEKEKGEAYHRADYLINDFILFKGGRWQDSRVGIVNNNLRLA